MNLVGLCGNAGSGKDTAADFLVKNHNFVKVAFADPLKRICRDIFDFSEEQLWGPSSKRNEPDPRYLRRKAGSNGSTDVRALIPQELREKRQCPPGTFDRYVFKGLEHRVTHYGPEDNYGFLPSPPEDEYLTPRYALQQLGTEWGRGCYDHIWVEYALRIAERLNAGGHTYSATRGLNSFSLVGGMEVDTKEAFERSKRHVVISDVRFKNEVRLIKASGGKVFRMRRGQGLDGAAGLHQSEQEMQQIPDEWFHGIIDNREWTLEQLERRMTQLVEEYNAC